MIEFDYEQSNKNLSDGVKCQSCTFEWVICLQECKCLSGLQEEYKKARQMQRRQHTVI